MSDGIDRSVTHKAWGVTELLESNCSLELHRLIITNGGTCSKHKHGHKWNGFLVEQGSLLIRTWNNSGICEKILKPGQYFKIPPGEPHQFEALTDTVAYEIYWVQFDPNDIVREI